MKNLKFIYNQSNIFLILGKRGSGKTAIGLRLLEEYEKKKFNCYVVGMPITTKLPKWITHLVIDEYTLPEDIGELVKEHSVIFLDEAGINFNARRSMRQGNLFLSNMMMVSRHFDLTLIIATQNSSNVDINVIRQADILLLKEPTLLQTRFERKYIKDLYGRARFNPHIDNSKNSYVYSDDYTGWIKSTLPSFWADNISKCYKVKK